jgi:hypothetical protein
MPKLTFEEKVNAGYYKVRSFVDFAADAREWLRERVPHHVVTKVLTLACPDPTAGELEMLHSLKKYCELFEPVELELAVDERDDRVYFSRCKSIQPRDSKPETGWSYEEAVGSMILRWPARFGFLVKKIGKITLES